jgi:hypothetical protein
VAASTPQWDSPLADVDKYLSALRRAQMEIDLHPELYKHYHLRTVNHVPFGQINSCDYGGAR